MKIETSEPVVVEYSFTVTGTKEELQKIYKDLGKGTTNEGYNLYTTLSNKFPWITDLPTK